VAVSRVPIQADYRLEEDKREGEPPGEPFLGLE
jgi:hypothetical protein